MKPLSRKFPMSETDRAILQSIRNPEKQLQRLACRATLLQLTGNRDWCSLDEYRKPNLRDRYACFPQHTGNMVPHVNPRGPPGSTWSYQRCGFLLRPRFLSLIEQHEDSMRETCSNRPFFVRQEALFKFEGNGYSRSVAISISTHFDPAPQGVLTAEFRMSIPLKRSALPGDTIEGYSLVYKL
jgi:hypothetical protein